VFARIVIVLVVAVVLWAMFARDTGAGSVPERHTVQPGETLWSLASERYRGDPRKGVWLLQERNGLTGTTIVPGQRLVLP
jgi:LysM repeat protein